MGDRMLPAVPEGLALLADRALAPKPHRFRRLPLPLRGREGRPSPRVLPSTQFICGLALESGISARSDFEGSATRWRDFD